MAVFDALRTALMKEMRPGFIAAALRLEILRLRFDHSYCWEAQRRLMEAGLRLSLHAYRHPQQAVFTSLLTPPEILYALELSPFGLETVGPAVASLGLAENVLGAAESNWAPADSCSLLRAALGAVQLGALPRPLALVCTSCLCDTTAKVFATAAERLKAPFRLLDVPYASTPDAVEYLAGQMEALAQDLAEMAGRRLAPARLAESIRLSNQARTHLHAIHGQRVARPGLLGVEDALGFLYPIGLLLGSKVGLQVFRRFDEELATATPTMTGPSGPRLLWAHLLPFYPHELLKSLAVAGATVVCEELSQLCWEPLDPEQPFASLARRCIDHFANGPLERRVDALLRLAQQHRVDGVVHFSAHGCRQSTTALQVLRDAVEGASLSFLEIEGDLVDPRNRAGGQQHTRLEAFVERLPVARGERLG